MSLILASSSPSRKLILEEAGIKFTVDPSNYEEDMGLKLKPAELAIHLSQGKAKNVAPRHPDSVILAADSFAIAETSELLGKPHTAERAKAMLAVLSGKPHTFITGYTLLNTKSGKTFSEAVTTKVFFRKLSAQEITSYVAKDNILEKAGAYNVRGLGAALVEKIEGNYSNICGLPLTQVVQHLPDFGIHVL